jgi:hypothetical protein
LTERRHFRQSRPTDRRAASVGRGGAAAAAESGGPSGEILAFVAWGMDRELREVFELVRSKLEELAGQEDESAASE